MELNAETDGIIVEAQDVVTHTRAYLARVIKDPQALKDSWCRMCNERDETLGHILSSCLSYKWSLYKERHDRLLFILAKAVMGALGITLPKGLQSAGGVAGQGVVQKGTTHVLLDQLIPSDQVLTAR